MNAATNALLTDLYQLNMLQAYLEGGETEHRGVRILRAQAAGATRLPDRRRARAGARFPRKPALHARRDRLARQERPLRQGPDRLSGGVPLHRRRPRHAGGHHLLRRRADPAGDGAAAAGAAGRVAADERPAFPVDGRRQGGAHGAGGARQAAGRFRPAPRARRRGRTAGGARELHRGLCRHRHGAGRQAVRHPDLRHHGAFVHRGARRRERRRSRTSPARGART